MSFHPRALTAAAVLLACSAHAATTVDLGIASQFSAITFGDFNGISGDTGKLLGVGGSATLQNWTVNYQNASGYNGYSFIVGDNLSATDGKINGSTAVGGSATLTGVNNTGPVHQPVSVLDFAQLHTQLTSTSASTAAAAATGTVTYSPTNSTYLTGTGADVEVFSIDGNKFTAGGTWLEAAGVKSNATVILNVGGTDINMASFGFDLPDDGKNLNLLVNFYEAKKLSFSNIAIEGAVLAPLADVTGFSGHIGGTFIAQSFSSVGAAGTGVVGNFEFHDIRFDSVVIPSPVPEPSEWALFGAGLLVAPLVLRRQRRREARATLALH